MILPAFAAQVDLLENAATEDVIVLSVGLEEVKHRDTNVRLRSSPLF